MSFFESVITHWKKTFVYTGDADKKEYWSPVIFDGIIAIIAVVFAILYSVIMSKALFVIAVVLCIALAIEMIPLLSLTVRRLHATGKSGWWSCLLFAVGIGTLIVLYLCIGSSSSSFNPENNVLVGVYGPPEMFEENLVIDESDAEPGEGTEPVDIEFEPEENMNVLVYGPPEMFEEEITEQPEDSNNTDTEDVEDVIEFEPTENVNADVYGPPEMFEGVQEDEGVIFEPELNRNELVYGPPEMMNDGAPEKME